MSLVSDGTGVYSIGPDGKRDYGTMTDFKINYEQIYKFDPATGVLSVSANPESCETLMKIFGISETESKDISMPMPPPADIGRARFKGVRKIVSLPPCADGKWFLEITSLKTKE